MGKADLLSRRADHDRGENDNKGRIMLPSERFIQEIQVESLDKGFLRRIKQSINNKDRAVQKALDKKDNRWQSKDGLIFCEEQIYVPNNKKLRIPVCSRSAKISN